MASLQDSLSFFLIYNICISPSRTYIAYHNQDNLQSQYSAILCILWNLNPILFLIYFFVFNNKFFSLFLDVSFFILGRSCRRGLVPQVHKFPMNKFFLHNSSNSLQESLAEIMSMRSGRKSVDEVWLKISQWDLNDDPSMKVGWRSVDEVWLKICQWASDEDPSEMSWLKISGWHREKVFCSTQKLRLILPSLFYVPFAVQEAMRDIYSAPG